jgi:Asp-tRNA(Asn)/Glu-tRNA(Gln) amidotransferase A subunit family amidase
MDILGKSLVELIDLVNTKKISSKEVYEYFLKRSKKYNPELNVYMTMVDTYKSNEKNDLAGLPIAVKDNFCTKGVRTTASAKVLDTFIPPYESTVTQKLLEHGASLLGKTNMDAWAHGSSTETSDYGPTHNPWDKTRMPGGSSGGSAAAVSAYLAPAAIGSETAGSIRQPAAWCGVVGLKPTYGRVSRYGVIAMGSSFDCPGPMTLNVEDTAYLMNFIAGKDPYDATTVRDDVPDYTKEMKMGRKLTIAFLMATGFLLVMVSERGTVSPPAMVVGPWIERVILSTETALPPNLKTYPATRRETTKKAAAPPAKNVAKRSERRRRCGDGGGGGGALPSSLQTCGSDRSRATARVVRSRAGETGL